MEAAKIAITAEPQVMPNNCLFRVDRSLFVGTIYISDPEWAQTWSPLAAALFKEVEGLKGVRIADAEVVISMKTVPPDWRAVARAAGQAIRTHLQADGKVVAAGAIEALGGHDLLRARAQKVIEDELNPMLASHGGWVEIQASDSQDIYITMGGGCQGCGSAAYTMKQGVEVALRQAVPELENIYDATDHASGANPYM
ncbi:MAG: NifU family protein [Planctomycetota bacterium]|nr:NifU family protein [Planctomycetota bacterium]